MIANRSEGGFGSELPLDLSHLILNRGLAIETASWLPVFTEFKRQVGNLRQPLGHGTTSGFLESILRLGLGAVKPGNSFSPELNSLCDLHIPDGIMAMYAFATWNETNKLAIDATKITGRDVVARYAETNPLIDEPLKLFLLRQMAKQYISKRQDKEGSPVCLIYEGDGKVDCNYRGRNVPSEVDCYQILSAQMLKDIFVPAKEVQQVCLLLESLGISARVLALELFELEEIRLHAPKRLV